MHPPAPPTPPPNPRYPYHAPLPDSIADDAASHGPILVAVTVVLFRGVKKSPAKRYGKPVMMASSDSGAGSDAGQGLGLGAGPGSTSDGEDTFPASYQPPFAGLMTKGRVSCPTPNSTCSCINCRKQLVLLDCI